MPLRLERRVTETAVLAALVVMADADPLQESSTGPMKQMKTYDQKTLHTVYETG